MGRIVVTGSIATGHLMRFPRNFFRSIVDPFQAAESRPDRPIWVGAEPR